jgi:glutamate racemase
MNNIVNHDDRPIGVFDSGIGGLTVLKEIQALMPYENLIYLGDLARIPYGVKSPQAIIQYTKEAVAFLISKNVKAIVIACNTVAAIAGEIVAEICQQKGIACINMIDAFLRYAFTDHVQSFSPLLILGTPVTIASGYYEQKIRALYLAQQQTVSSHQNTELIIYSQPCELFVPFIEEGLFLSHQEFTTGLKLIIKGYLRQAESKYNFTCEKIHTIVLACTHYPIIRKLIAEVANRDLISGFFDPAYFVAEYLKCRMYYQNDIDSSSTPPHLKQYFNNEIPLLTINSQQNCTIHKGHTTFYITDSRDRFMHLASVFLDHNINNVYTVTL